MTSVQVSDRPRTLKDFINALSPMSSKLTKFFPDDVRGKLSEPLKMALPLFDREPRINMTLLYNVIANYRDGVMIGQVSPFKRLPPPASGYSKTEKLPLYRFFALLPATFWTANIMSETDDSVAFTVPDIFDKVPSGPPPISDGVSSSSQALQPPTLSFVPGFKGPMSRINVSGVGLLCGARALRGLIFTHTTLRPSVSLLAKLCAELASRFAGDEEDETSNFTPDTLVAVGALFGLGITILFNGSPLPGAILNNASLLPARLYLDGVGEVGHYNYYGRPISEDDDDTSQTLRALLIGAGFESILS